MKKSILKRMAEEADNRVDAVAASTSEASPTRRHSSPVISNVGRALTQLGEDSILSLDPNKIEASPFHDRFENDLEGQEELDALKVSILTESQKIPVLVRPHPTKHDYYQLAYGHRRLAAIRMLMAEAEHPETVKIKAFVRDLSDRQLIEEQAVENGVRENLTWIEQAMWAVQLKNAGLSHRAMCPILGLSEAGVSHLFRVTAIVPSDIVFAIGRAKSVGRPKWTAFAELLKDQVAVENVRRILPSETFRRADGARRIALAMNIAARGRNVVQSRFDGKFGTYEFALGSRVFGQMKSSAMGYTVTIPSKETAFANWLAERMPDLVREYDDRITHDDLGAADDSSQRKRE